MKALLLFGISLFFTFSAFSAEVCFKELGNLEDKWFGSFEQLIELQELAKSSCPQIGIAFEKTHYNSIVIIDFESRKMFRLRKTKLGNLNSWEQWTGFSKKEFLSEDGSDGIDFGIFQSQSGEFPNLGANLDKFLALKGYPNWLRNK